VPADLRSFAHTNAGRGSESETCNPAVAAKFVFVFTPERDTIADVDSSDDEALLLLAVAEDYDRRFVHIIIIIITTNIILLLLLQ
jgi:hypothetical protein